MRDNAKVDYQAFIFDLDGTLLDTEAIAMAAGMQVADAMGLTLDGEFFASLVGKDGGAVIQILAVHCGSDELARELKSEWGTEFRRRAASGIPLKPGVPELLDLLDEMKMPRAVATNSSHEGALLSLERAGIADRFEVVVGHDLVARAKPAPDVYLRAAELLSVSPGRCLAFEDSDLGAQAASLAGMFVVQVPDFVSTDGIHADILAETLLEGARRAGIGAFSPRLHIDKAETK